MDYWWLILLLPLALVILSFVKGYRSPAQLRAAAEAIAGGAPFIDVRTPAEYSSGHARKARNIPLSDLRAAIPRLSPDEPVVLYCRSGSRSGQASRMLQEAGFTRVLDLGPLRNTERLPQVTVDKDEEQEPASRNQRKRQRRRQRAR